MNGFEKIEHKLDFVKIRESVLSGCSTEYAKNRVNSEEISINAKEIELRLTLTDEMRLICLFETSFPSQGFIDCIGFLKPLEIQSGVISLDNLVKLNAFIGVLKEILNFFTNCAPGKYPNLKKEAEPILFFLR